MIYISLCPQGYNLLYAFITSEDVYDIKEFIDISGKFHKNSDETFWIILATLTETTRKQRNEEEIQ